MRRPASHWIVFLISMAASSSCFALPTVLSSPVTNPVNGHSYYLLSYSTWTDAELTATSLGGHLATIRSADENQWVYSTFARYGGQDRDLWIGLNDVASEGTFVWSSGEPITYLNWYQGGPSWNGYNEDFVHMIHPSFVAPGMWNDFVDDPAYHYIRPTNGVVEVVPEPSGLLLVMMSAVVLRRRRIA